MRGHTVFIKNPVTLYSAPIMFNFLKWSFLYFFVFILWVCFTLFLLFSCYTAMTLLDFVAEYYYCAESVYVLKCALLFNVLYFILFVSYLSIRIINRYDTGRRYKFTVYFIYVSIAIVSSLYVYVFKTKITHYFYLPYTFNKCSSWPWDALSLKRPWSHDEWEFIVVVCPILYLTLALFFLIILDFFIKRTGVLPFLIKSSYFLMITLSYWHEVAKTSMALLMVFSSFFTKTYFSVDIDGVKSWIIKNDSLDDSDIIGLYSSIFYDAFSTSLVFILLTKLLFSSIFYLMALRCFNTCSNDPDNRIVNFVILFTVAFYFIILHALSVYCLYFGVGFIF